MERTRLLVHLIDTSDSNDDDPVHSYEVISGELAAFSETLTEKPLIVVATKLDATSDHSRLEALRDFCRREHLEFHSISAATGEGVKELVRSIADALDKIPKPAPDAADALDAVDGQMSDAGSATSVRASVLEANAPLVSGDKKS